MQNFNEIIELRRQIHKQPELAFEEVNTTNLVEGYIQKIGLTFHRFKNLDTGGFCDIGAGKKTILFRADIDALPILEDKNNWFRSEIDGKMHACGHDYHAALGVGLLDYLNDDKALNDCKLRVVFQPGEEAAPGGAEKAVEEDIWEGVEVAIATHVDPNQKPGTVILSRGPVQASSTSVKIKLLGPGGHTSKPHEGIDLVFVTSQFISQLQSTLRQIIDPRETLVFGFGSINGGQSHNIYPQGISLFGTIRSLDNQVLAKIQKYIREFSENFAKTTGIHIDIEFPTSCPATINDDNLLDEFVNFASNRPEINIVSPEKPSLGADDFSHYSIRKPGFYLQVGSGGKGALHTGDLELDESFFVPAIQMVGDFIKYLSGKL